MSNLESAKTALESELAYLKQGRAYYQTRVEALMNMLDGLTTLGGSSKAGRATRKKDARKKQSTRGRPSTTDSRIAHDLPFTGGDFWENLVIDQPRSAPEILQLASASLGFAPTKVQVKKLAGRQTLALNAMVRAGKIQNSGAGRSRRFFKR